MLKRALKHRVVTFLSVFVMHLQSNTVIMQTHYNKMKPEKYVRPVFYPK